MNTKQKILDKALELFNERGIEYVGLRELAAELNMRVGNLTYYFPTKDDLVFHLSQELSKANAEVFVPYASLSMQGFLALLHRVFQNHWQFRCLFLSFVHLMSQNKQVAEAYKQTQNSRTASIQTYLEKLKEGGYLVGNNATESTFLVSLLALINRFWLSEAKISFRQDDPEEQMRHYLQLIARLLLPYATEKGATEIREFLQQRKD